jgi:ribonuclease HII
VSAAEIDQINIYRAGLLAMRRALEGLSPRPQHVLLDARKVPEFLVPQTPIIKGDALSLTIGAASIIAKTHRDGLLAELDRRYPGYGFAVHKGYPVTAHVEALRRLGPCPEHRRSFAPVREVIEGGPRQRELFG